MMNETPESANSTTTTDPSYLPVAMPFYGMPDPSMTVVSSRLLMMTDGMKIPWLFIFFCAFSVIAQHLKKLLCNYVLPYSKLNIV